jgi:hypothetical protein
MPRALADGPGKQTALLSPHETLLRAHESLGQLNTTGSVALLVFAAEVRPAAAACVAACVEGLTPHSCQQTAVCTAARLPTLRAVTPPGGGKVAHVGQAAGSQGSVAAHQGRVAVGHRCRRLCDELQQTSELQGKAVQQQPLSTMHSHRVWQVQSCLGSDGFVQQ